jgi:carboxyl-terminal processing protease
MRPKFLYGLIVVLIVVAVVFSVSAKDDGIADNSKELFGQIQLFADALTLISADYVKPIKAKDLVYGAIKGMMRTLDGYSQFLDQECFEEMTVGTKGEFGGIGIEIGIRDGVLTVIAPIENTPAFKAGVQAGDRIVKIDGKITRNLTLDEAVKKMRGEPGTDLTITVIRESPEEIRDFTITRAVIKLESIEDVRIIEENIGYIRILEFQERTAKDLRAHVKALRKDGAKSLILDLRNNPGGLLTAAVEAADEFLQPGSMIVYTEGRDPAERTEFKAKKVSEFDDMNLAVLVNKGSASAAEILAGALKDNKRALVIGVPTFGKGSVQTVIPLKDKSALRLTTAAYYTPSGKNLMDKGVEPNIYVKRIKGALKPKTADEKREKQEKEKTKLFEKVKEKKKEEKDKVKKEKEKPERYDNQLQAAVNALEGVRVFEEYRASKSGEDLS